MTAGVALGSVACVALTAVAPQLPSPSAEATSIRLTVDLCADPGLEGPAAWVFFRERASKAAGLDGDASEPLRLEISFGAMGDVRVERIEPSTVSLPEHLYLRGELTVASGGVEVVLAGDCSRGGHGRARVENRPVRLPAPIRDLSHVLGVEESSVLVDLELAALCGMQPVVEGGGGGFVAPLLASWCGDFDAVYDFGSALSATGSVFSCSALSDGGLLLPVALLLQAAPSIRNQMDQSEVERLLVQAALGSRSRRHVAALALGLERDGPQAEEARGTLESLADHGQGFAALAAKIAAGRPVGPREPVPERAARFSWFRGTVLSTLAATALLLVVLITRSEKR